MTNARHALWAWLLAGLLLFSTGEGRVIAQQSDAREHVVQPGDTLFRIALMYGLTVEDLARANQIVNYSQIFSGQRLVIPGTMPAAPVESNAPSSAAADAVAMVSAAAAPPTRYHTVRYGEPLSAIATRYSTTVAELVRLNNLNNPNLVYSGQQLIVSAGAPATTADATASAEAADVTPEQQATLLSAEAAKQGVAAAVPTPHVVRPGETLGTIATRYGVPWTALAAYNNVSNPNLVMVGQTLMVPASVSSTQFRARPGAAPGAQVGTGRELVVSVSNSSIYAYEDGRLMRQTLGSMGRAATPTVTGRYRVYVKYRSQTMSGPGYYLPNVEYVMYFYAGYAVHGAYWHTNWGTPMSHGCVNLPNEEAAWYYDFASVGTPVTVLP